MERNFQDKFMNSRIKNFKRRSISIPEELDKIIEYKFKCSNYSFINDILIELLELGLMKLNDNEEIKYQNEKIISKLDELISLQKQFMDSKVVFIAHPYYGINNPDNNLRIYKKIVKQISGIISNVKIKKNIVKN